jgi:hypothetical protein
VISAEFPRLVLGMRAECLMMVAAVVLSQDLDKVAGQVADGPLADPEAMTGNRVTVTGTRREGDLLICLHDVRPAALILHRAHATCTPCGR